MVIDWEDAPSWAMGHGRHNYRNYWIGIDMAASVTSPCRVKQFGTEFNISSFSNYKVNPVNKEWPTDERITQIAQNGGDGLHYDEQREQHNQPTVPQVTPSGNKYDRPIVGKYGSGKCVVDVYRVLNAFGPLSPEIDHAIKKLLAPGKRGSKDELKDLKEAVQSIEARISYLNDTAA